MTTEDKIQIAVLAVQVFVGVIQLVTTIFFIKSVGITGRQEKDAREQIDLAREQTKLTREQMRVMTSQFRESLRPLLIVTLRQVGSNFIEIEIRNDGLGPALEVCCDPNLNFRDTVVGSKGSVVATIPRRVQRGNEAQPQLFTLTYKSVDGGEYSTSFLRQYDSVSVEKYWTLGYPS